MRDEMLKFRHEIIDPEPPGAYHDITLIADVNGDGRENIIIGSRDGEITLFWYESPSWKRHDMAFAPLLEAGGVVLDITGNGRPDVVAGQQAPETKLWWFECPEDPTEPWPRRMIEDRFVNYHDQTFGDVDGDGEVELVFPVRNDGILVYYDIPPEPRLEPWPHEYGHIIGQGFKRLEGVAVADINADGRSEIICGPHVFRPGANPTEPWQVEPIAPGYVMTRIGVADLDGDGRLEIVLCEGESEPGRLTWFSQPDWRPHVLRDDLFHPHTLQIADFNGDGLPDIFVAEMGLGRNPNPRMFIYRNRGAGRFQEVLIEQGIAMHEAKVGDLTGNGQPDIVGKPYLKEGAQIHAWFNET